MKINVLICLVGGSMAVQIKSDPICNSAGCTQYLHPKVEDFKKNYFVPNFGRDHDINVNFNSLDVAEAQLGHKWKFPKGEKKKKVVEYKTDLAYDEDVISTEKNIKSAEETLGHDWKFKLNPDNGKDTTA